MNHRAEGERAPVRITRHSLARGLQALREALAQGVESGYITNDERRLMNLAQNDRYFLLGAQTALDLGTSRIVYEGLRLPSGVHVDVQAQPTEIAREYAELLPKSRHELDQHYLKQRMERTFRGE